MPELKIYSPSMQPELERFFEACFTALGWGYHPESRHADILKIGETYMKSGCFWCLREGDKVVGTSAVRAIAPGVAELKRLYVLPGYQGKGYGRRLFDTALEYAREQGFDRIRMDTQKDRDASRHLAEGRGFREIPQYNDNQFAEVYYELELKNR
ncbi:MAG: GNAT family N-acetyltransferase [Defluviitaleaceae bacterium]|nr:GNAT family N-acetyltransferase [Defluviitaleaceae bacterium]